jgi:hypothetical protein
MLKLRGLEYPEAARALGATDARILVRHLIPNAFAPVIVSSTLVVGSAILNEAALSFLGIGIQPPIPSWGNMLQNAQDFILTSPWLAVYPGLMIFLTVLCFNFLGDGLRDALDPRMRLCGNHACAGGVKELGTRRGIPRPPCRRLPCRRQRCRRPEVLRPDGTCPGGRRVADALLSVRNLKTYFYTDEMVRALPEDGNRYETVHGELLLTPAPRYDHQ